MKNHATPVPNATPASAISYALAYDHAHDLRCVRPECQPDPDLLRPLVDGEGQDTVNAYHRKH